MNATAKPRIAVTKDGPYIVTGCVPLLRLAAAPEGETWRSDEILPPRLSYALCRCGRSKMQPFCDYKHLRARFDGREMADRTAAPAAAGSDVPASIGFVREADASRNGPLWVRGAIEVVSASGVTHPTRGIAALCRCGASRTKPFCDGSHEAQPDPV